MTAAGAAGGDSIKVWREAARMAASLTLLQITGVDPMRTKRTSSDIRPNIRF